MKKVIKKIVFAIIVISLIAFIGLIVKKGKFAKLEGYMYSFAGEIAGIATEGDATSTDATSTDATSTDATSSNATSTNATCSDATSSDVVVPQKENIKINNEPKQIVEEQKAEKIEEVEEKEVVEETLEYNNSEINDEIIKKLIASDEAKDIIITTSSKPNIVKELFEAIQGKSRKLIIKYEENEIIFNGKNIVEPKEIDTSITYNVVSKDLDLKEVTDNGIVINFANNGELPGIAKVRIKLTEEIKNALDLNTIYIYYYDENKKELTKLSDMAQVNEDYIEFKINHNSKYLLVNNELEEKVDEVEDDTVTFLESHKMYVIIIGISVLTIIFVTLIVIVDKKTK